MPYQIDVTDAVPGTVFTLRRVIRTDQVGTDIGVGLAELYAEVAAAGLQPAGPPSATYLDPLNGRTHVDLGVTVTPRTRHAEHDVHVAARHSRPVARTVHHGDYAGIGKAHRALADWVFSHGYQSAGPPTETYLVGPDTTADPTTYRTEVSIPVLPSIGLSVRVDDDFTATVDRTRKALGEGGFGILTETDVRAVLRERLGADIEDFLILGACDPRLAKLAIDTDRQAGVLLPCTVAIRADGDTTVVEALDPAILVRATGLTELEPVATEARERLARALASLRTAA